ncbi:MAG TPA: lipase family protein [Pyrinomonadaceae bacterium]|nr:lipase family protein [Pyrinomonadaceae bacterium]
MLIHSTGVQPPNALSYGMFVEAAYQAYAANLNNLNPSQSDYPSFPEGYELYLNVQMTDFFLGNTYPKYYGFIARNTANPGQLVMAIRGTQTWQEWWDDFDWALVPYPYAQSAGKVANGFLKIYKTFAVTVPGSDAPATLLENETSLPEGTTSIVAVGHSLGSALVTLYALNVAARGALNPTVYTLASPRVGDRSFANAYDNTVATNFRIYNWPDLVPDFPKDPFDNYYHVKGAYEVDSLDHPLTVKMTVDCFHSVLTYLYLLGAPSSILGGWEGCGY